MRSRSNCGPSTNPLKTLHSWPGELEEFDTDDFEADDEDLPG